MYYPCSENKDADQLRGYREADLRLCFRPCKLLVFSRTGSYYSLILISSASCPESSYFSLCNHCNNGDPLDILTPIKVRISNCIMRLTNIVLKNMLFSNLISRLPSLGDSEFQKLVVVSG